MQNKRDSMFAVLTLINGIIMTHATTFGLSFCFNETSRLLQDTIAQFAEQEIAPMAEHIDQSNQFPRELWPKLGELGVLGITVDPAYGGAGMGYLEHVI